MRFKHFFSGFYILYRRINVIAKSFEDQQDASFLSMLSIDTFF